MFISTVIFFGSFFSPLSVGKRIRFECVRKCTDIFYFAAAAKQCGCISNRQRAFSVRSVIIRPYTSHNIASSKFLTVQRNQCASFWRSRIFKSRYTYPENGFFFRQFCVTCSRFLSLCSTRLFFGLLLGFCLLLDSFRFAFFRFVRLVCAIHVRLHTVYITWHCVRHFHISLSKITNVYQVLRFINAVEIGKTCINDQWRRGNHNMTRFALLCSLSLAWLHSIVVTLISRMFAYLFALILSIPF